MFKRDRMAGANIDVYEFDGMVRGLHIYKTAWTPLINETLQVYHAGRHQQTWLTHSRWSAVVIFNRGCIVGHISRIPFFLNVCRHHFNVYQLWHPWARHLLHSFCCTTQCILQPMHVYEPSFIMHKYGIDRKNIDNYTNGKSALSILQLTRVVYCHKHS